MASLAQTPVQAEPTASHTPWAMLRRDGTVAFAGLGLLGGLYLDGWAHVHLRGLESFFTPWHGVLYSGFLLLLLAIVAPVLLARRGTPSWRAAIPTGYGLGLLGVALFTLGGLGDMVWHNLFGIETDTEALLSPPHLLLAVGAGLMVTTPLRAAWERDDAPQRWASWLPPLLSMSLVLALTGFFTSYAHPFARTVVAATQPPLNHAATHAATDLTMAAIVLQSAIGSGCLLVCIHRWGGRWLFGSLTLVATLTLTPLVVMFSRLLASGPFPLVVAAALAGLTSDVLLRLLQPAPARPRALRGFAAAAPATLVASYLTAIGSTSGLWWSWHLIFGAVVLAGITGWLISYLVAPTTVSIVAGRG